MSKTKETARKDARTAGETAQGKRNGNSGRVKGETFTARRGALTVRLSRRHHATLERAARAMNACAWCDKDNTALTVFRDFLWNWFSRHMDDYGTLAHMICEDIDTGASGRAKRARLDALARAFADNEQ